MKLYLLEDKLVFTILYFMHNFVFMIEKVYNLLKSLLISTVDRYLFYLIRNRLNIVHNGVMLKNPIFFDFKIDKKCQTKYIN